VAIFSMTFNKNLRGLRKMFQRWLYHYVDHFFVVSAADKQNLQDVVPENKISVTGDTRYEQCLYRLNLHLPLKINATAITKKVFIAGSTWPEDEDVLIPFIARHPELCHWILVPHEIDPGHIEALVTKCRDHRLNPSLYSKTELWDMQGVLIVDSLGVLAHLYKIADYSFVGGSFKKQVHSVMESLACGCLTFVGPHYHNNREAIEFSKLDAGFPLAPVQTCDAASFEEKFLVGHREWTATQSDRLKALVASKARVSGPLYEEILKQL
jgi:3-deoxy-D-manno-octulosonic-acid transferase